MFLDVAQSIDWRIDWVGVGGLVRTSDFGCATGRSSKPSFCLILNVVRSTPYCARCGWTRSLDAPSGAVQAGNIAQPLYYLVEHGRSRWPKCKNSLGPGTMHVMGPLIA
jgi:hypothetical protein